jgi:hypothetical protein
MGNLQQDSRIRQSLRSFPSPEEIRAAAIGADELITMAEWVFRFRTKKLRVIRTRHRAYCAQLLREIERSASIERSRPVRAA